MALLFFDIETVNSFWLLDKDEIQAWKDKYPDRINFMPEFNKIITICVWKILPDGNIETMSIDWEDEEEMIKKFFDMIQNHTLVWFNIKNFDIPFLVKRALFWEIKIPDSLKLWWKKPWDVNNVIDLYEVYKHMGRDSCSLGILCDFLYIPSPKDSIDGSQVQSIYDQWWLPQIIFYCREDVRASAQVYQKFVEFNLL
jgi:predicted PolB exonuclease-like 3'-5' exonuclease